MTNDLADLSDGAVIAEVIRLAGAEQKVTAQLVAALAELDTRRLYLGEGCSSLFTYCTKILHLSEHAAYSRIEVARAARRFPPIFDLLLAGAVTVTTVGQVARVLTEENHRQVLARATHKSKRQVEELVAELRPRPEALAMVRKLPVQADAAAPVRSTPPVTLASPAAKAEPLAPAVVTAQPLAPPVSAGPVIVPLAPERYKVQFTVSRETYDKLRRVQDLMRNSVPSGDPAAVFDRALTALLTELEKAKIAAVSRPRGGWRPSSGSRHTPACVKREVWKRDRGQCAFQGTRGRCAETGLTGVPSRTPVCRRR